MNYSISLFSSFNILFLGLLAIVALLLGKAIYTLKTFPELKGKAIKEIVAGGIVALLVTGIFIVVPLISGITIEKNKLSLRLPTGFTFTSYSSDEIVSAKIVDLETQPEYAIYSKVVGTQTRDYSEGIFRLGSGETETAEAQVFLNGKKALYVETKGMPLLLGPDHFEDFVSHFSKEIKAIE
ncbi:MAG: hypothetical protein ACRCU3_04215 [Eubacteriaceae bacterium]